jgi:hypothetical protein
MGIVLPVELGAALLLNIRHGILPRCAGAALSTLPIPLIAWTFAKRIRFGNEHSQHSDRKMSARRLSLEVFSAKEGRLLAVPHVELIQRRSFPFQP